MNVKELEDAIIYAGLFPFTEDKLAEFPEFLHKHCGKGIGIWQYPNQFSRYLSYILDLNIPIRSYLEIGCAAGGTFTFTAEVLKKKWPDVQCIGIDPAGAGCTVRGGSNIYTKGFVKFLESSGHKFISDYSHNLYNHIEKNTQLDLVLIDGDHSYEGVKKDFEMIDGHSKIIVLHDIVNDMCPGVVSFWNELRDSRSDYSFTEFTDQYDDKTSYLGIGVLVKI
jgi:cephalosporin hydroxylase